MMLRKIKLVKNRKQELKKKRIRIAGIGFVCFLVVVIFSVIASLVFMYPSVLSPLPKMTLVNDTLSEKDRILKEVLVAVAEKKITIKHIGVASDGAYVLELDSDETVLISPDKDIRAQISSLQLILSRLTMEDKRFSRLDLRYDKPVIVFK